MRVKLFLPLLATAVLLSGCEQDDPNSPVGQRKAIFKQMLSSSEHLGGMLRGRVPFDSAAFLQDAERLNQLASQPWQYFVQADQSQSTARDAVWERRERFNELARELEQASAALLLSAQTHPRDKKALAPHVQRVEDVCESCHSDFRAY